MVARMYEKIIHSAALYEKIIHKNMQRGAYPSLARRVPRAFLKKKINHYLTFLEKSIIIIIEKIKEN